MSHSIQIETPDGRSRQRKVSGDSLSFARWLEAEGFPLNTRCGGRGICRGCLVHADGNEVRACQTLCSNVSEIQIPEPSLRDHSLTGVSSFEIGIHNYALRPRSGIGLALDIGTTTVAVALWDLRSGACLGHGSTANEQRRFGDNVLARIDHALTTGGTSPELQSALVRDSLLPLIDSLCKKAEITTADITEGIAAGNTVMQHSLAKSSLAGFGAYPFKPVFLDTQQFDARELGFHDSFPLTLAANLGAFVGADITVGALASGMLECTAPALLIDFGTNGEILLKMKGGYLATATAAGPAFEGGRLNCGAAAGAGVVSSIRRENDKWKLRLIDDGKVTGAIGISGAAYVDFIACAVAEGLINSMGRFDSGHGEVVSQDNEQRIYLNKTLYISETDVAELIQAKAAIAAGAMTLLEKAELTPADLKTVYIAGGFGYHLDIVHAMAIGMLPAIAPERISIIGNASLGGASLMLQSECDTAIQTLRKQSHIIELNQIESFEDNYIDCMPLESIT